MNRFLEALPILGSFLMIILILFAAWYVTRWYARRMASPVGGKSIRIIDRASLSNTTALMIANVDGAYYLLGVSEHSVNLLCELPDFQEPAPPPAEPVSFQRILEKVIRGGAGTDKNKKDDGGPE